MSIVALWLFPCFALGDLLVLWGRADVLGESVDEVAGAGNECERVATAMMLHV